MTALFGVGSPAAAAPAARHAQPRWIGPGLLLYGLLVLAALSGGASLVKPACPVIVALLALAWSAGRPAAFLDLLLWSLVLSPLLRHVVDWHAGFSQSNPVMLSPYCAAFAASPSVLRYLVTGRRYLIEILALIGLVGLGLGLSLSTGLLRDGLMTAMRWLAPVWVLIYLLSQAAALDTMRTRIRRTFSVAIPAASLYGLVQFVSILPWDAAFMREAPITSIGYPLPFLVRIFSTMNSPGSFAAMLCTGLLLMLPHVSMPLWVLGLAALALTTQRAAMAALLLALLVLALVGRDRRMRRGLVRLGLSLIVSLALVLSVPGAALKVSGTVGSVARLADDTSAQDRWAQYLDVLPMLDQQQEGRGLGWPTNDFYIRAGGSVPLDSGLIDIFVSLGVIGGGLFLCALASLTVQGWLIVRRSPDAAAAELAACLYGLSQLPFGSQHAGEHGMFLFLGLGLLLARPIAARAT